MVYWCIDTPNHLQNVKATFPVKISKTGLHAILDYPFEYYTSDLGLSIIASALIQRSKQQMVHQKIKATFPEKISKTGLHAILDYPFGYYTSELGLSVIASALSQCSKQQRWFSCSSPTAWHRANFNSSLSIVALWASLSIVAPWKPGENMLYEHHLTTNGSINFLLNDQVASG